MSRATIDIRIEHAGSEDLDQAAALFDGYRQFYRKPANLGACRRYLSARFARRDSVLYLGFAPALLPTVYFPEWGTLAAWSVFDIQTFMLSCSFGLCVIPWWQLFFPGLAVFMFAVSVNLLSDGLRDALDPRLRR